MSKVMEKKFVCGLFLGLLVLGLLASIVPQPAQANPAETIYEDNFDDQTVGFAPKSLEWSTYYTSAGRWWATEKYFNRSTSYFRVTDTQYSSSPNSLMSNDTSASYGNMLWIYTRTLDYNDAKVQLFFRKPVTNTDYPVWKFYLYDDDGGLGETLNRLILFRFASTGYIQYYTTSYVNLATYSAGTWYNVTMCFNSVDIDTYINGAKYDVPYRTKKNFDRLDIYFSGLTDTGVGYVDNIKIDGTRVAETFYTNKPNQYMLCGDDYVAYIMKNSFPNNGRGYIKFLYVQNSYGNWQNFVTCLSGGTGKLGLVHSETWKPPNSQTLMSDETISFTVSSTSTAVNITATAQSSLLNYTNQYYFFKSQRYFFWRDYRKYNYTLASVAQQRQLDFLYDYEPISKLYFTNATNSYSVNTTPQTKGSSRKDYGYDFGSPSGQFPYFGYYMRQNITFGLIVTYMLETDNYSGYVTNSYEGVSSSATYLENEITFGKGTGGTPANGGLSTITNQTIEEAAGVVTFYEGDESLTEDVKGLSQSLFSGWGSNRVYLGLLVDSTNDLYLTSTATIKSRVYSDSKLTMTVNASSGVFANTEAYVGDEGQPTNVEGAASWSFNNSTKILTILTSGLVTIIVDWTQPSHPSRYDVSFKRLTVIVTDFNGVFLREVQVTVWRLGVAFQTKTTNTLGEVTFSLSPDAYMITAEKNSLTTAQTVTMNEDKELTLVLGQSPTVGLEDQIAQSIDLTTLTMFAGFLMLAFAAVAGVASFSYNEKWLLVVAAGLALLGTMLFATTLAAGVLY